MNEKANKLLADVRAYTVELYNGELTDQDCERLKLMVDVFRQIRADGAPDYPIMEYVKNRYDTPGACADHSDRCPNCGEPFTVQVEDGDDCLECVAGREDPDEIVSARTIAQKHGIDVSKHEQPSEFFDRVTGKRLTND